MLLHRRPRGLKIFGTKVNQSGSNSPFNTHLSIWLFIFICTRLLTVRHARHTLPCCVVLCCGVVCSKLVIRHNSLPLTLGTGCHFNAIAPLHLLLVLLWRCCQLFIWFQHFFEDETHWDASSCDQLQKNICCLFCANSVLVYRWAEKCEILESKFSSKIKIH